MSSFSCRRFLCREPRCVFVKLGGGCRLNSLVQKCLRSGREWGALARISWGMTWYFDFHCLSRWSPVCPNTDNVPPEEQQGLVTSWHETQKHRSRNVHLFHMIPLIFSHKHMVLFHIHFLITLRAWYTGEVGVSKMTIFLSWLPPISQDPSRWCGSPPVWLRRWGRYWPSLRSPPPSGRTPVRSDVMKERVRGPASAMAFAWAGSKKVVLNFFNQLGISQSAHESGPINTERPVTVKMGNCYH